MTNALMNRSKEQLLALSTITFAPFNPAQRTAKVENIAQSISEQGQLEPLHVVRLPDGRLMLADGHRRATALKQLGFAFAKAYIYDGTEEQFNSLYVELNKPKMTLKNAQMVQVALQDGPVFDPRVASTVNYLKTIFAEHEMPALVKESGGSYLLSVAKRIATYVGLKKGSAAYDKQVKVALLWLIRNETQQPSIAYMRNKFSPERLKSAINRNSETVPYMGK